jgi:predicted nuclease of restriction endonuclease-like (RecB) superfamily
MYFDAVARADWNLNAVCGPRGCLVNALTGATINTFGNDGRVNLREGLGRDIKNVGQVQSGSPGHVFENLIILGSAPGGVVSPDSSTRGKGRRSPNFKRNLPPPDSDMAQQILRDPYNFDFLTLADPFAERELERGLLIHLRDLLLELGRGFAFVGSQVPLVVDDHSFYVDLLFYHIRLHCYFVIELKTGEFQPEYAGMRQRRSHPPFLVKITLPKTHLCFARRATTRGSVLHRNSPSQQTNQPAFTDSYS